jgi:hypothetical protein
LKLATPAVSAKLSWRTPHRLDLAGRTDNGLKLYVLRHDPQAHTCPTFENLQIDLKQKAPSCWAFAEPSDRLEPSTSSLHEREEGVD